MKSEASLARLYGSPECGNDLHQQKLTWVGAPEGALHCYTVHNITTTDTVGPAILGVFGGISHCTCTMGEQSWKGSYIERFFLLYLEGP